MSWREDMRRVVVTINGRKVELIGASFRGVPFLVETVERSGGRRVVVHEFPLRDAPFIEDLGRAAVGYRVDGYVLGDDYLTQKNTLLDALEGVSGPGELVLPGYPTIRAICKVTGTRESKTDGGIAMLSLEFAETPLQAPVPVAVVDAPAKVSTAADAAILATQAEFAKKYSSSGLPSFALASAEGALTRAAAALQEKLAPIISATQELAEFTGRISILTAEASSLVRTPDAVLSAYWGTIVGLVETAAAAPGAVLDALLDTYLVDLGPVVVATTSTRARELANQTAFTGALRRILAIEAARLAPLVPYSSIQAAITARDDVAAALDDQAQGADDTAYPALVDLRSQVLRAVPGGQAFASVVTVTRKSPIPSLLLTYQLYGSVDNELDVVARNRIRHPGFVSGDLQVLSDG